MNYTEPMFTNALFKGKTFLVTGGGTGLGKSMTQYLSQLGANVVICSRKLEILEQTANEIQTLTGNPVFPVQTDVRNSEEVANLLTKTLERFGSIHGLVNNAAGNFISPTERLSPRAFESVIGIVLQGSINCSLELGKWWIKESVKGNIINIITTYAWTGSGYTVPSACAKGGVLALTRSLAVEWGRKYGIRVNAIAPGPFPTKGAWERLFPKEVQGMFDPADRIPLARVGEKQELSNLIAYLLSDYSAYINGEVITIDGGEWLENGGQFNDFRHLTDDVWDLLDKRKSK